MKSKILSISALSLLMASCANNLETNFNSKVTGTAPVKMRNIFIVASIDDYILSNSRIVALENGLIDAFRACEINATLYKIDKLSINGNIDLPKTTEYVMSLSSSDGKYTAHGAPANGSGTQYFNAELKSTQSRNFNWRARFGVNFGGAFFDNYKAQGRNIAKSIVSQLEKDGVISGCNWALFQENIITPAPDTPSSKVNHY